MSGSEGAGSRQRGPATQHIAMRLQHAELAAANLSTDNPDRVTAKATIIAEVERLHWRIWNGKAKNAQRSIKRMMRGPSRDLGDHAALAKAGSALEIRSNRCPNPAPSVPL